MVAMARDGTFLASRLCLCLMAVGAAMAGEAAADALSGEWSAPATPIVQVVALGNGSYRAHIFASDGRGEEPVAVLDGTTNQDVTVFAPPPTGTIPPEQSKQHPTWWPAPATSQGWSGRFAQGTFILTTPQGASVTLATHAVGAPTIDLPPPAGAVVLIGPDSTVESIQKAWLKAGTTEPTTWTVLPGGILEGVPKSGSALSRQTFGDCTVHLEFRLPFEPSKRGQLRANSGLYFQGRYETQILDSFGLQGVDNECGGFYKIAKPRVNACAPPLIWQTYDAVFHAAGFTNGKQTRPAQVTLRHNGILIHSDQALDHATTASHFDIGPTPQGIYLQDHGHAVQFRNLWVLPTVP